MKVSLRRVLLCLVLLTVSSVTAGKGYGVELAKGTLLAASEQLVDPRFRGSVILLLNHDVHGSSGLVVNRASRLPLTQVFPGGSNLSGAGKPLYYGGPVRPESLLALVLVHGDPPEPAEQVLDGLYLTRLDILDAWQGYAEAAVDFQAFVGYVGWAHHQLENEMNRGDWHVLHAEDSTNGPDAGLKLWERLQEFQKIGGAATRTSQ